MFKPTKQLKPMTIKEQIALSHEIYILERKRYAIQMRKYREELAKGNTKVQKPLWNKQQD